MADLRAGHSVSFFFFFFRIPVVLEEERRHPNSSEEPHQKLASQVFLLTENEEEVKDGQRVQKQIKMSVKNNHSADEMLFVFTVFMHKKKVKKA